jgi:hypothetical protein
MNNVRRFCSIPGDVRARRWRVRTAMTDRRYLVRNVDTGEYRAVPVRIMGNLY